MKTIILILTFSFISILVFSKNTVLLMKTTEGDIKMELYENTPLHTENFLSLVEKHFYDSLLFHRVIKEFMIQAGDPDSKKAKPGKFLGSGDLDYTVPAEFVKENHHKKGALAAARQGDNVNPLRASSASQFYIVHGKKFSQSELNFMEQRGIHMKFTPKQIKDYTTIGGAPHLDYQYTVFGEVVDGFEVIDKIANHQTDKNARPLKDVRIISIKVISK